MKRLPRDVKECITKARESAILAVGTYNQPGVVFRSGGYIMLMVTAWTALFHAIFLRDGIKPFYVKVRKGRYVRYEEIDGQWKAWELSECIKEYYKGSTTAERKNLEFIVGLRNRIEHRSMPELDDSLFGECQALLFNFEALIEKEFGNQHTLNESLAVTLQFSRITPAGKGKALRELQSKSYPSVQEYVERFRSGLSSDIEQSLEYSFRVFLIPKTGNHADSSDIAVDFIDVTALDEDTKEDIKRAITLLKTKETAVAHPGQMKPSQVAVKVQELLGFKFRTHEHTLCWKHFKVRPLPDAENPKECDIRYCQYDVPHGDYIYTDEWVDRLVVELSNKNKRIAIFGKDPLVTSEETSYPQAESNGKGS